MGRKRPCCEKKGLKKGPWSAEEDQLLTSYIMKHGQGQWRSIPKLAGLTRCGKSCRLRWTNYLRPDIKRGPFTDEEEKRIIHLHSILGNKWAAIAAELPGRTDNEIKNLWNTSLRKRLINMGLDPQTHLPLISCYGQTAMSPRSARHKAQWESAKLEAEARLLKKIVTPAPYADPFLRLWNSEVGEAFRKIPAKPANHNWHSISGTTVNYQREMETSTNMNAAGSACSSTVTYQPDDSSVSTFQLLMDMPYNNEMSRSFFADHFIF